MHRYYISRHGSKRWLGFILTGCLAVSIGVNHGVTGQPPEESEVMTQQRMERIIAEATDNFEGRPGMVRFTIDEFPLMCISDVLHDRMRIIAPILKEDQLTDRQRKSMLEANFHTSLDARYATSHGVVYAAYLHPLTSLDEFDLRSAVHQVANLARSFGTHYSSGELRFGDPEEE